LARGGRRWAIVSGLDRTLPPSTGAWDDVRVYTREKGALDVLCELLADLDPARIGVNYSEGNPLADGLSHGRYLSLERALQKAGLANRPVSAEGVAAALRQVKTPTEIERICTAIAVADEVFARLRERARPGSRGSELFTFTQRQIAELGASCGWSAYNCPIMTIGPVAYMGHTPPPADAVLEKGMLMQVDLGVRYGGYCADFQRMFYALKDGETQPPAPVRVLFDGVYEGISRIVAAIAPGVPNDQVSKAGFDVITGMGFPEPAYSAGHQLGRAVHDGGCGLVNYHSPAPGQVIRAGNVFTVEGLETRLAPYGWVSLEENVVVTEDGCRVLTNRQREIYCV
jgi:Xaa-Pro aminopeptidase